MNCEIQKIRQQFTTTERIKQNNNTRNHALSLMEQRPRLTWSLDRLAALYQQLQNLWEDIVQWFNDHDAEEADAYGIKDVDNGKQRMACGKQGEGAFDDRSLVWINVSLTPLTSRPSHILIL